MPGRDDGGPCFFCPDLPDAGGRAELGEEETHHAGSVRRIRVGDRIGLIDGLGSRAVAVVESVSRRRLTFTVSERRRLPDPDPAVHIASAIPKGERFRVMIDVLSQAGVAGIRPLLCERGTVRPRRSSGERWRRIAIEACKQSRNPRVPGIREPQSVEESLKDVPAGAVLAFADFAGEPARALLPGRGSLCLYIGPEGGFTDDERSLLREAGAAPVSLGDNVLRVETAAIVGAVLGLFPGPHRGR